jgi:hypothetical protein
MKNSLFTLIILFSALAFGQEDSTETPKIVIKIPLGQTVDVKGVSVRFTEVVEDSRCPKGVDCFWMGRAIVKVKVTANGKSEEKTMIFGALRPGEEENTNIFSSNEFAINGVKLNPYPTKESMGKDTEYTLLICEEKNR